MYFLADKGFDSSNLLPGTGMSSLMETIKLTSCASNLQMAGALIVPSFYYNNPTDQGVIDYYSKIIESINNKEFKILLYHIPQISGVPISFNIIESLIHKYPNNVIGINNLKLYKYKD